MNVAMDYPHGKPRIPVPQELFEASFRLRRADYSEDWLRQTALPLLQSFAATLRPNQPQFTNADEIYYLWALCLQAEIHDYYGAREAAEKVLREDCRELEKRLNKNSLGFSDAREFSKPLLRQQLWTLVFYAHCHYRAVRMEEAKTLLLGIRGCLDEHLPLDATNPDEPSYGIRSRVCYSLGQVARQLSDVGKAREEFIGAITFTKKRLADKVGKPTNRRDLEQVHANYILAKALAFGLAWASYHSGELQRGLASAAAGSALLETTHDEVHKAYARVMYAQILTAAADPVGKGQDVSPSLAEALDILTFLAEDKMSPLLSFPKFRARAQYNLARALYAAGQYDKAESRAREVYEAPTAGPQSAEEKADRWRLECAALLVRLLLRQNKLKEARAQSEEFLRLTEQHPVSDDQRAEACLCRAEVLMHTQGSDQDFKKAMDEAKAKWRNNPLSTALCHLQSARFYCRKNDLKSAREELAQWKDTRVKIEHGHVKQLAASVMRELQAKQEILEITPAELKEGKYDGVQKQLKRWVIERLYVEYKEDYLKSPNPENFLGRTPKRVRDWQIEVGFDPTCAPLPDGDGSDDEG